MKTPHTATVYHKDAYWSDIQANWWKEKAYDGACLPRWVNDFVSVHCHKWESDPAPHWSLCSPMMLVEHPSCTRPSWESWCFETYKDAIAAAKWIARNAQIWVVDCCE